jgi:signal transduction histidine kinase
MTRRWTLPALAVGAGLLLTTLALGLAVWSKSLVKDALRHDCVARASLLTSDVRQELSARVEEVRTLGPGQDLPAEVETAWFLDGGQVVRRLPASAADPSPFLLDSARAAGGQRAPIGRRGARVIAAAWEPDPGSADGERGVLLQWNVQAVEARILTPLLAPTPDSPFVLAHLESQASGEELPFRAKAGLTLDAPFSFWRVAVGLRDPEDVRTSLRAQTALLVSLALGLALVLIGSVWLATHRARAEGTRQAAREQFLTRAYHELQTPLAVLRAAAETLVIEATTDSRGTDPADLERCAGIVTREEERLTRSLRRLLRYLRVENAGGRSGAGLELGPVDEEIEDAVAHARPSLAARGLSLEVEGAAPGLLTPRELVADAVRELLANAEKHARGATRVRLAVEPCRLAGAPALRITCQDDGQGLGESDAAGSKVGLELLRDGLALVGGSLTHTPAPGGGARFQILVPCGTP